MPRYQLTEHTGGDVPSRYYVDGRRVSYAAFETLRDKAHRWGKLDCFQSRGRQLPGGRIRRTNWSSATLPDNE